MRQGPDQPRVGPPPTHPPPIDPGAAFKLRPFDLGPVSALLVVHGVLGFVLRDIPAWLWTCLAAADLSGIWSAAVPGQCLQTCFAPHFWVLWGHAACGELSTLACLAVISGFWLTLVVHPCSCCSLISSGVLKPELRGCLSGKSCTGFCPQDFPCGSRLISKPCRTAWLQWEDTAPRAFTAPYPPTPSVGVRKGCKDLGLKTVL